MENNSSEVASGVKLNSIINIQEGIYLADESKGPIRPDKYLSYSINSLPILNNFLNQPHPNIDVFNDHWELNINFGDILPGYKKWTTAPIYVGAKISHGINFEAAIYAKNLPEPTRIPLSIQIEVENRPMEIADVEKYMNKDE